MATSQYFDDFIKIENKYVLGGDLKQFHEKLKKKSNLLRKELTYVLSLDEDEIDYYYMTKKEFVLIYKDAFFKSKVCKPLTDKYYLVDNVPTTKDNVYRLLILLYLIDLANDEINYMTTHEVSLSTEIQELLLKDLNRVFPNKKYAKINPNKQSRKWKNRVIKNNVTLYNKTNIIALEDDLQRINRTMVYLQDHLSSTFNRVYRTEFNYTLNQTIVNFGKKNSIFLARRHSILDNATSDICLELDGMIFDIRYGEVGIEIPPNHVNCRTFLELLY